MKGTIIGTLTGIAILAAVSQASALPVNNGAKFSVNGAEVAATGIDGATGFGTRNFTFTAAGSYQVRSFFDLDLDVATTGFSYEFGRTYNSADPRMSWEVDEPGYWVGNLYEHFLGPGFDRTIGTDGFASELLPDDVAVGMGWDFDLGTGYLANLAFTASEEAPSSGFYIAQYEGYGSYAPVYYYGTLEILPVGEQVVPEPSTFLLLGTAMGGLALCRRKSKRRS